MTDQDDQLETSEDNKCGKGAVFVEHLNLALFSTSGNTVGSIFGLMH